MYGTPGRLLRINLSNGAMKVEKVTRNDVVKWVGCDGLAVKILYDKKTIHIAHITPHLNAHDASILQRPIQRTGVRRSD